MIAALCLAADLSHNLARAQAAPLSYWTPGWPAGFGGAPGENGADSYGGFPGFDAGGGAARYNFANNWFVGSVRGMALAPSGAFGNVRYDGAQVGYNFQGAPVTVTAGFTNLKVGSGLGTALSSSFSNPASSTVAGYSSHVGVEFHPTSNLSLSFGAGVVGQGNGLVDSDIHSDLPPGASPLAFGRR